MNYNFYCFSSSRESEVLELFERWKRNGWDLTKFFIKVTHGPGGFRVFYDGRLNEENFSTDNQ